MQTDRPQCTISKFGKTLITQKLFRCNSCHFSETETMCEECAKFCHQGHDIVDLGYHTGYCMCGYGCSKCHCFLEHPVPGDLTVPVNESRQCMYRSSGSNYVEMDMYNCESCGIRGGQLTCHACSLMCHREHRASFNRRGNAYCDCGDPSSRYHCLLDPPNPPPTPIPWCTFLLSGSGKYLKQKNYRCITCGMTGNVTLCESCAKTCHEGHQLEETGYATCYCDCGAGTTNTKCKIIDALEPAA